MVLQFFFPNGSVFIETVISEGPDPSAQADPSSEPDTTVSQVVPEVRPSARTQAGFAALDMINVRDIFTQRACVMKVPPEFLKRSIPFSREDSVVGDYQRDGVGEQHQSRQRLEIVPLTPEDALVQAPQGEQGVQERTLGPVHQVRSGLVVGSLDRERGSVCSRHRDAQQEEKKKRAERAEALICLGKISAARRALEASPVAPGTEATYRALTDAGRRPPEPRDAIPDVTPESEPVHPFETDKEMFLQNLRTARRGAAGSPSSGMRNEHLRPLLDNDADSTRLFEVSQALAQAKIPE